MEVRVANSKQVPICVPETIDNLLFSFSSQQQTAKFIKQTSIKIDSVIAGLTGGCHDNITINTNFPFVVVGCYCRSFPRALYKQLSRQTMHILK